MNRFISAARVMALACAVCLLPGCGTKSKPAACGSVVSARGTITVSSQPGLLTAGSDIHNGDTVGVGPGSRITVGFGNGRTVDASENTRFVVDSPAGPAASRYPEICILGGELFLGTQCRLSCALCDSPAVFMTPSVEGTRFFVAASPRECAVMVACMSGLVNVQTPDGGLTDVPSCYKLLVVQNRVAGDIEAARPRDYKRIAACAGISPDSADQISLCTQMQSEPMATAPGKPPVWKSHPKTGCRVRQLLIDTLTAADPDNGAIIYKVVSGPANLSIDSGTGELRFFPRRTGQFPVQVSARISLGASATTSYLIHVYPARLNSKVNRVAHFAVQHKGKEPLPVEPNGNPAPAMVPKERTVGVTLDLPSIAEPGDTVILDASRSGGSTDSLSMLRFRFDADGNGTWDIPASGYQQNPRAFRVYSREGMYRVAVEAVARDGRVGRAEGNLMVRIPPSAAIDIRPPLPVPQAVCTLDARKSTVSGLGRKSFVLRWDLDDNGTWDFPPGGGFTANPLVLKSLAGQPPYRVVLQIKDEAGLTSKAIADIPVTPKFAVILLSMPDTVLTGIPFTVACQTSYPPSAVAEYDWRFAAAGTAAKRCAARQLTYSYDKPGAHQVTCTAVARNGNKATSTRELIAIARAVTMRIMVPPRGRANVPLAFDARITPHNTTVKQVSWDFDGDRTFDWSSHLSAKTTHVFPAAGTVHPVLRVISADNRQWFDTATVDIGGPMAPRAMAGKDILARRDENVRLAGQGVAAGGGRIILYEWDFNDDGVFDWKSAKTGKTSHRFIEYGRAVLRVTADNGLSATDTLTIVVCPTGMIGVRDGPFCIDTYEYPDKKGQLPVTGVSWTDADRSCRAEGKRLCTAREWEKACAGPNNRQYPVSSTQYQRQPCNVLTDHQNTGHEAQSGLFGDCRSPLGVFDMNGNVAEWTAPAPGKSAAAFGGSWLLPEENAQCSSRLELDGTHGYPYVGFRCCK